MPVEIDGDLYIDGGSICNYPIQAFHYRGPNGDIINPRTIGLMLVSDNVPSHSQINNMLDYGIACVEYLWARSQKFHMDDQDWARTIKIPTGKISSIGSNITHDEVRTLIKAGKIAVSKYFSGIKTFRADTFQCVRAPHTEEDEVAISKRDPRNLQSAGIRCVFQRPRPDDWESIVDGLTEIRVQKRGQAAAKIIKRTVGSSPPIAISQFRLE